jgi:uracil phosphoribosyltransferase
MLATGGSLAQVCDLVLDKGARTAVALCIIASEPALVAFTEAHPLVPVVCAAVDPILNEVGFIVPGPGRCR